MALERTRYYAGQRLDADDLRAEQHYQARVRRLLNQGLFTPGVVQGLEVERLDHNGVPAPRTVVVRPGTALDALGRLIVLDAEALVAVPNQLPVGSAEYYLVLRYDEEPVPGRADDCAPVGSAPVDRVREQPVLDWSEVIPFPRPGEPEDSIEQGVVIARVRLDPSCKIEAVDADTRRLSFPRNVSRVQAVAFEGEKDIAEGDPKKLYFHIRGGRPRSVVLFLRGARFSPTAYTESAAHSHTLSSVAVGSTDVTTQDHRHDMGRHAHGLVHGPNRDPGLAKDGAHVHAIWVRARVDKDRPREAVSTDDYSELSKGYYERGWKGTIGENKPEFDDTYLREAGLHTHQVEVDAVGPTTTGSMTPAPSAVGHHHTFAATVDPVGSTGFALRGGAAFTFPTDVRVELDGKNITKRLVDALPTRWKDLGGTLGGDENHPFNTEGTGPIDLVQLGLALGPGEHLLEFCVGPGAQPPVGGKIIYNLYVE
jgi:hypothetical protein